MVSTTVRVQTLSADKTLPLEFIRPIHERPANSPALSAISPPIISLSKPHSEVMAEMSRASHEWGFFQLADHGIPDGLIRRLRDVGEDFFRLPEKEKERLANDPAGGKMEGYGTKMVKNADEKLEWIDYYFHLISPPKKISHHIWPSNPNYREVTEEYEKQMSRVAELVMEMLSEGLGLQKDTMKRSFGGGEMELEMKINMYPPCPQPEVVLGVEPHTDMSAITILVSNDVPGLQVWKDGNWVEVNHPSGVLLIHIGDQIEVLSNGKYKSVLHRSLVNREKTRMSWAVFCVPPPETVVGPLAQLTDDQNRPKFSTKAFGEFRHRKINKLSQ